MSRILPGASCLLLAAGFSACSPPPPQRPEKVGTTALQFHDASRQRPIDAQLWYPAAPGTEEAPLAYDHAFRGHAALDAPPRDGPPRPLVVFSHGDRGGKLNQSWLAEALAGQGYVVLSIEHWLNTRVNNRPEATMRAWDRPVDASYAIGALLGHPQWGPRIDASRIGAAGFSSGGYTALALAGARYAPVQMGSYCRGPDAGPDCLLASKVDVRSFDFSGAAKPYRDERVRAALAMAPALGPGMMEDSLRAIRIPVLIAAARDDEIVPYHWHAERLARAIPGARLETFEAGGHFVFMPECTLLGWAFTYTSNYDICGREHDVDRAAVHGTVIATAWRFFDRALAPAAP